MSGRARSSRRLRARRAAPRGFPISRAAARVSDALTQDVLLAPIETSARGHGQQIYQELVHTHRARLAVEREKGEYAFTARRRAVERIGLPAVRDHRLTQLAAEERSWREQLERKAETSPELVPLLLVRVEGGGGGE